MRSCRTSRARLAPSAIRTAISASRVPERASIRLATFEQAISKTMPATVASTRPASLTIVEPPPNRTSPIGRTVTVCPSFAAGYIAGESRRDRFDIGLRLRDADARFQPPYTVQHRLAAIAEGRSHLARQEPFGESERQPQVWTDETVDSDEARPRDTDHGDDLTVQPQLPSDNVRRPAKAALPCTVVHDGDGVRAITRVCFGPEGSTHGGFYRHFGTKEDLVVEAFEAALKESGDRAIAAIERAQSGRRDAGADRYVSGPDAL